MRRPPPSPDEFQAGLYRYVRDPRFAELRFEHAVFEASEDFNRTPFEIFDDLSETDF